MSFDVTTSSRRVDSLSAARNSFPERQNFYLRERISRRIGIYIRANVCAYTCILRFTPRDT